VRTRRQEGDRGGVVQRAGRRRADRKHYA
jgi:hypothetical protein